MAEIFSIPKYRFRKLGVYKHFSASYSSKISLAFSINLIKYYIMRLCNFNRIKLRDRYKEQDTKGNR